MNEAHRKALAVSPDDLRALDGRVVLVKTTRDHRNPPTGMRGFIEVRPQEEGASRIVGAGLSRDRPVTVNIVVEFPQMFTGVAHHRTIPLNESGLERLLASERNGTFEYTIDDELL